MLLQQAAAQGQRYEQVETATAERKARDIQMTAAAAMADRLYRLALAQLPKLRDEGQESLFVALAAELPPRPWQRVRVNPADERLARTHFPQAEVVCDAAIVGGMEVAADEGRIRVGNTLKTRLRTAWPDLLSALLASVIAESPDHRPAV